MDRLATDHAAGAVARTAAGRTRRKGAIRALVRALPQRISPAALLILLLGSPALAADGVLEINQDCAAVGCFPGDAPGFPVTIDRDQTGSYRLTGNLVNLDPNSSVIAIEDDHVTLDLNGFALSGPTVCTGIGSGLSCDPAGSGIGVEAVYPGAGSVVKNGVVRGMASDGIHLQDDARVEGVHAVGNGGAGILVLNASVVENCRVARNGGDGIFGGGVIRRNVVFGNGLFGISSNRVVVVTGNVIRENLSALALADPASLIVDNVTTGHGSGFLLNSISGYARNILRNTGGGAEVSGGIEIGPNLCGTNTTCP